MTTKTPRPLSAGEEEFAFQCKAYNLKPEREVMFAAPRRWRFDFCFPTEKIAVEIEGGIWNGGRHTTGSGFESDLRKYNHASALGWRVFRFSTAMVTSGNAIDMIREVLK